MMTMSAAGTAAAMQQLQQYQAAYAASPQYAQQFAQYAAAAAAAAGSHSAPTQQSLPTAQAPPPSAATLSLPLPSLASSTYAEQLKPFWQQQMIEVEQVGHDAAEFKNHQLPLARIKKIMKSDEDVRMISAEAPVLFAKACEIFILELTLRSWIHAEENKRRTLQRNDIAAAIVKTDIFDFLIDIVPREDIKNEEGGPSGSAPGPVPISASSAAVSVASATAAATAAASAAASAAATAAAVSGLRPPPSLSSLPASMGMFFPNFGLPPGSDPSALLRPGMGPLGPLDPSLLAMFQQQQQQQQPFMGLAQTAAGHSWLPPVPPQLQQLQLQQHQQQMQAQALLLQQQMQQQQQQHLQQQQQQQQQLQQPETDVTKQH
ncbi:MAG: hypothetical protein WDW36_005574 [Sanguina aurantia]